MSLAQVRSQDQAVRVLRRAFQAGKLHHGFLVAGPGGVGKSLLSQEMGRLLICESPTAEPDACGACRPCRVLDSGGHPDVIKVSLAEGKTRIAVEQIRTLRAQLDYPPHGQRGRAVIFEKADLMTEEAQNALLKTLEEPSSRTHLFLTTTQPSRLLPTIRSRCSRLDLSPLPRATLEALLDERLPELDAVERSLAIGLCSGSVSLAVELAQSDLSELTRQVEAIDRGLAAGDIPALLGVAEELAKDKTGLRRALELVALWYRDVLLQAAGADDQALAFDHKRQALAQRASQLGIEGASARVAAALEATEAISRRNANPRLTTEDMLLRMLS